ncbi:MAG: threonylcarbamoyl-AMP synthase [Candidatus Kerfeldbacteria bacterium CG_4_10_14_0_8_um_filter_42_10]|uniref:L-threonylcarbamoyladenylate synthase n=1 Tax=Candidatus Kerfeldbacteria bacterium CG_4_10_14_0_8_um_filter_42_10 TaxID=2014248 RepID=A0A2M7RKE6_9BACT|nr:MAG: threonylcarbamoyl-AMP synthase [Candidatus Kerfeldbacteria bacterium CG_4_10_14_0_8_um_filter_42_10]
MRIIEVKNNKLSQPDLKKAILILKKGGIIIYPTETAYAIGGDALNKKVIKKIFSLKSRSQKKPLPVIAGSFKQAKKIAVFDQSSTVLAKKYWPGPLTLILKRKKIAPAILTAGKEKIAVRVAGLKIAREISIRLNRPLVSTSANVSGKKECYTVKAILKQSSRLTEKVDIILDAGKLPKVKPSTIAEVKNGKIKVLREGPIVLS